MANSKTITLDAATEQTVTRRGMLLGLGAATASAAVVVAPSVASSQTVTRKENPELLKVFEALEAARKEEEDAKDALEWLADEWRHLWPLAPEALLVNANADARGSYGCSNAERDIIGRYLRRETSDLTRRRFTAKWRQMNPISCFSVMSPEEATESLDFWRNIVPKGRTEKSLATCKANRERAIAEFEENLILATRYRAETEAMRKAAGVQEAKDRIEAAKKSVRQIADDISYIEAFTNQGLRIKVNALTECPALMLQFGGNGNLGPIGRFLEDVCLRGDIV